MPNPTDQSGSVGSTLYAWCAIPVEGAEFILAAGVTTVEGHVMLQPLLSPTVEVAMTQRQSAVDAIDGLELLGVVLRVFHAEAGPDSLPIAVDHVSRQTVDALPDATVTTLPGSDRG